MDGASRLGTAAATAAALTAVAAMLATAAPAGHRTPAASAKEVRAAERSLVGCTNHERTKRGLPALRVNRALGRAARYHARNMLRRGFFDHTDPARRGPGQRVDMFGKRRAFGALGENIAAGYRSASASCRAWIRSHGHRSNILHRGFTMIGAGYASGSRGYGTYWVQVLGGPRASR